MLRMPLVLTLIATPAMADTNPADLTLSPIMKTIMASGFDAAATQLATTFEKYSADGETIVLSHLADVAALQTTENRANKVYGYLSVDLNWDGTVTREELERVFATPDRAPFVDGYLKDGDLDGDGVITLSEMIEDAIAENPSADVSNNGYLREMIDWDLNGDGVLHFEELLAVIEAHQN